MDHLEEVQKLAQEMIRQKHYDSNNIKAKSRALGLRCSTHFLSCQDRNNKTNKPKGLNTVWVHVIYLCDLCRWGQLQQQSRCRHEALVESLHLLDFLSSSYQVTALDQTIEFSHLCLFNFHRLWFVSSSSAFLHFPGVCVVK